MNVSSPLPMADVRPPGTSQASGSATIDWSKTLGNTTVVPAKSPDWTMPPDVPCDFVK